MSELTGMLSVSHRGGKKVEIWNDKGQFGHDVPLLKSAEDMANANQHLFDDENRAIVLADPDNPDKALAVFSGTSIGTSHGPHKAYTVVSQAVVKKPDGSTEIHLFKPVVLDQPPTKNQLKELQEQLQQSMDADVKSAGASRNHDFDVMLAKGPQGGMGYDNTTSAALPGNSSVKGLTL